MATPRICSIVDCDKPAKARGWCGAHHERWRKYGDPAASAARATLMDRFNAKYRVSEDGCWLWQATRDAKGYGHIGVAAAKSRKAHRVSYELHVGPIPEGMQVCHKCDTPSCVNPGHLFIGTAMENMADRDAKGRGARGERSGVAVLTDDLASYIRSSTLSERALATELGVHRGTINAVRSGRTWGHVQ